MIDPRLTGHVAVVTGANQGIGAAIAVALATQGVSVLATYLRMDPAARTDDPSFPAQYGRLRAQSADSVVDRIVAAGGKAVAVEADLADPAVPARLFDEAAASFGPVDILVNNASGWFADTFRPDSRDRFGRPLTAVDAHTVDRQFAVDARAPALMIAEFARRHVARKATWGRIIGLTSGGPHGFPQEVSYGAAKAAQENYTLSAAAELGPYGVTANTVHPPVTDTGWVTPEVAEAFAGSSPPRRVARPEDVAEVVVLLAAHQSRYVTGQVVRMT
ncbi:SDR family NAD(P)-dependent oxidoreductase [Solwaraspora sp. WMMD406]|uniref:SDR family NAD(P)-dependent oxidoreductase n=1 Tax=Solwaraspora sp. WMMD406 TaxID=3016095 RepID=UPI0024180139|nr:SDR family oxidoreductase [Solwaraspora sp. WMMD406]MDG4766185.1 SDR family NAD(P)-dependent oxidoreductase [Solwaraspora sp. WMMD406]